MRLRILPCLLGLHKKKWVGVFDYPLPGPSQKCPHGWWEWRIHCNTCPKTSQVARWSCEVCIKMGEHFIMKGEGLYTVKFGCLVPDEKRWGDGSDPQNKNGLS